MSSACRPFRERALTMTIISSAPETAPATIAITMANVILTSR